MHGRRLTLQQIHSLSPTQRAERVAELLAKAVAIRLAQEAANAQSGQIQTRNADSSPAATTTVALRKSA